jgi:hypothetical protein
MVNARPRPLYLRKRDAVSLAQEVEWVLGLVWMGAENLTPNGTRPRTVKPVTNHYTGYAIRIHKVTKT